MQKRIGRDTRVCNETTAQNRKDRDRETDYTRQAETREIVLYLKAEVGAVLLHAMGRKILLLFMPIHTQLKTELNRLISLNTTHVHATCYMLHACTL